MEASYSKYLRNSIILETLVHSADENYITARWCNFNYLHIDFLWLSLHALEKYMKAALLANGYSSKTFSHDIENLFSKIHSYSGDLLLKCMLKPKRLAGFWPECSTDKFIRHLMNFGNPHNRYLIYGYNIFPWDVHMVDQLIWSIRRLIRPLDDFIYEPDENEVVSTNREYLANFPDYYWLGSLPIENIIRGDSNSNLRQDFLNLNFPFAPNNFEHKAARVGSASSNSALDSYVFEELDNAPFEDIEEIIEVAVWAKENIQFPKNVVSEIDQAIGEALTRKRLGLGS